VIATDLLCVAPHTDDAEIGLGGTLRLLSEAGRRVWVCDLTRGELASNATPEERWQEAQEASAVLGLSGRVRLSLPDGFLSAADREQVEALVHVIRLLRPRWLVCSPAARRHPDHLAAPGLVQRAAFLAGLVSLAPPLPALECWRGQPRPDIDGGGGSEPHRPEAVLTVCDLDERPSLIFDCSRTWQAKLAAIACYGSQFRRSGDRRPTRINDPLWHEDVERRGRYWGYRAGAAHGEALRTETVPVLGDLPRGAWR
jgi:bacillithiol biosynthesis deacetylase BshB1